MAERTESRNHLKEIWGLLFLALCVFFTLCLVSYDPADPALNVASNVTRINNLGGIVGAYVADILFFVFGISAYFLCGVLFLVSLLHFLGRSVFLNWKETVALAILVLSSAALIHLRFPTVTIAGQSIEGGGLFGGLFGSFLADYLNLPGAVITCVALFIGSMVIATHMSVVSVVQSIGHFLIWSAKWIAQMTTIYSERFRKWCAKWWEIAQEWWANRRAAQMAAPQSAPRPVKINLPRQLTLAGKEGEESPDTDEEVEDEEADDDGDEDDEYEDGDEEGGDEDDDDDEEDGDEEEEEDAAPPRRRKAGSGKGEGPKIVSRLDAKKKAPIGSQLELARMSRDYKYPPLALLDSADQVVQKVDEKALRKQSQILELKMKDYGVEGHVTEIHPGPVITMYELQPAPGVKVNKVVGIEDDLSVAMGGKSIRIIPHIPGKAVVGVEIPNAERETVWLKEVIGDEKFVKSKSKLSVALGKNTEGHIVVGDLTKMPHLLVAGATGSGKSVAINAMITSILYKSTPAEVRMIMVDPKMLELSVYDGIPHLLLPVVTKPRLARNALQWGVREMERRYKLLSNAGVRNIASYNTKIEKGELPCSSEEEARRIQSITPDVVIHTGKLPFIVIIIDELADLMMTCAKEVEESIARLAQMARAAGIHLILATQRPSVDVITGLIKANFPSRIAFKVSSRIDARTIMDTGGAEKLLGMGDMLFMPPTSAAPLRIHGAYITEDEISRIVTHVKEQGQPIYDESILESQPTVEGSDSEDEQADELYDQAIEVVSKTRQASISMIQRRFRIGYNRAARIIERMEAEGIVGPQIGSKPREINISSFED